MVYLLSIRTRIKTIILILAMCFLTTFTFYPLEQGLRPVDHGVVHFLGVAVYLLSIRTRIKTADKR